MFSRRRLLTCIFILTIVFISLQFFLFSRWDTRQNLNKLYTIAEIQNHSKTSYISGEKIGLYLDVKREIVHFVNVSQNHGIEVVWLYPDSTSITNDRDQGDINECRVFCNPNNIFTFIVPWHPPQVTPSLIYRHAGFSVKEVTSSLPRSSTASSQLLPMTSVVSTHILLSHQDTGSRLLIHLVLIYTFIGDYRWFGALLHREKLPQSYGWSMPGIIKMFDIKSSFIDGVFVRVPGDPLRLQLAINQSRFIECNHTRAAMFHALYSEVATKDVLGFKDRALDIIKRSTAIFDRLGVRYWLSSGTCLGWFRQCSIIPYSADVDFGVWIKDYDARIIATFQNAGFRLKMILGRLNDSYELSFFRDGIKVDIFFFYDETDYMWNGGTQHDDGSKYKYKFPKFTVCWSALLGVVVRVPCETESYVVANYGPRWFEPVTAWSWKSSPYNVVANGAWKKSELDEVAQIFDAESEIAKINFHEQH